MIINDYVKKKKKKSWLLFAVWITNGSESMKTQKARFTRRLSSSFATQANMLIAPKNSAPCPQSWRKRKKAVDNAWRCR